MRDSGFIVVISETDFWTIFQLFDKLNNLL